VDFDVSDQPTNIVLAGGARFANRYDALGRLADRTEVNSNGVEHFGYSANLPWLAAYTNQLGTSSVLLTSDPLGRLTNQVFKDMATNRYTYNAAGDLLTLTDGKGQQTIWVYDKYGRVCCKTNADSTQAWTNTYNANGWVTAHCIPTNRVINYAYDAVGNLTNIDYPNSPDVRLTYDAANRLTGMSDAVGTHAFTWMPWGALASEDGPWADDTVAYGYDDALLRETLNLLQPNGSAWTQNYAYDDQWRLTNITAPSGAFAYTWTGARAILPARLGLPNSAYITNTFDALGRLASTALVGTNGTVLNSHAYLHDLANERTKQTLKEGNYWDYGYDSLGQLTSASGKESGGATRLQEQLTYGYDAAGNLAARTNNNLRQTFAISNILNQLSAVTRNTNLTVAGMTTPTATSVTLNGAGATLYADKTFAKELTSVSGGTNTFTAIASDGLRTDTNVVTVSLPGSVTFQYDANGNLTSDGSRGFEYDDANQLTAVQVTNSWRSEFKYDGLGRRRVRTEKLWQNGVWVIASETRYIYDHMLVLQERDANNLPTVTYTRGVDLSGGLQRAGGIGGLLARTDFQGTVFYHGDAGGNITAIIDGYRNVVARYHYDPFGNLLGLSGPLASANLYRFSSKEWHANSGLYYYGFRFYEPSLQRWLNRDPIGEGGGCNLYGFVGNSPLRFGDPYGLNWTDWIPDWLATLFGYEGPVYMTPTGVPLDQPPTTGPSYSNLGMLRQDLDDYDASGLQAVATVIKVAADINPVSGAFNSGYTACTGVDPNTHREVGAASRVQATAQAASYALGAVRCLGRGVTASLPAGTSLPRNLREQLAVEQAMASPLAGRPLPLPMTDARWPAAAGWVKMQQIITPGGESINVHYLYNTVTGEIDDFKIVLPGSR
jgi:RHS repeat-associated protein